jgi:hypothetical protein
MACCEGGVRFRLYPKPPYGHPEWPPETVSVSDPRGAGGADDRIRRVAGALNTKIKTAAEDAGWLPGLLPAIGLSEARAVDLTQPEGRGPALLAQKKAQSRGQNLRRGCAPFVKQCSREKYADVADSSRLNLSKGIRQHCLSGIE